MPKDQEPFHHASPLTHRLSYLESYVGRIASHASRITHHSSPIMNQAKSQFLAGVKSELPILVGVTGCNPFGLIFGVLAANAGLSPYLAWSTSQIIIAGSAQFLALPLIQEGAPPGQVRSLSPWHSHSQRSREAWL